MKWMRFLMFWRHPAATTITPTTVEYSESEEHEAEARAEATRQYLSNEVRRRILVQDAEQRRELARMGAFQRDLNDLLDGGRR